VTGRYGNLPVTLALFASGILPCFSANSSIAFLSDSLKIVCVAPAAAIFFIARVVHFRSDSVNPIQQRSDREGKGRIA
jgi:hypothetical protein